MGPLVYVMGPSGAGKDSVMNRARALLTPEASVFFAHRYITRPADSGGENHVALTPAEFALRRERGLFAFDWQAHGNRYGIGCEIDIWRGSGLTVVVSGSREHFLAADGLDQDTHPVLITAPPQRLAERLAARGREDSGAATLRLGRGAAYEIADPRLVTIVNDGALEAAAQAFVSLLARLRHAPAARRRAGSAPAS
ncbi:MAG: phosphonate metabolism protein/1,5-bisphosphokinase (PRPP-forming) PhnN [Reyranella sp.]|uniref:phosphonate metabolism protein/1,5-bisphosphokinase (PRPP-forming) PhnN n=1 Tax=Reyranella sp. TaxID=1929291 RepID=UPI001AC571E3|nr:phosphonate metabolism protein/1,5-bisphosphokinase (PRPP-forming) PhnN [Reyranella sp.]MBN9091146.1 phosphonate metabolism protein/1,5-bisphosphokinase (PRPP-forming) PhnN [Reyranella sp.]